MSPYPKSYKNSTNIYTNRLISFRFEFSVINDDCEFAALTQISTAPLTVWYTMKLCKQLQLQEELTVHLIGKELEIGNFMYMFALISS